MPRTSRARPRATARSGWLRADRRRVGRALGAARCPRGIARGTGRSAHPRATRRLRAGSRELHRHGQSPGRPRRPAARQREHARGDFYVPLATTEAALVASYSRGAQLLTEAGGCAAVVLNEGVSRAPAFAFETIARGPAFRGLGLPVVRRLSPRPRARRPDTAELGDLRVAIEGNHVHLILEFLTGDAAGQNMATIAADAICRYIETHAPIACRHWFVESNLSGDKKATTQSLVGVRGRKVSAEIVLPPSLVAERLHTTVDAMLDYWRMSVVGGVMSGSVGVQGHYANGLAAMFIACGQDAACVAEGSHRHHAVRAERRRRPLCGGDAAEPDRRHGGRRDRPALTARVPRHHASLAGAGRARVRGDRRGGGARRRAVDHRRAGGGRLHERASASRSWRVVAANGVAR